MRGVAVIIAIVTLALFGPAAAFADPYSDLMRVQTAFQNLKSLHADEHLSNGKTVTVDYVAPDRWRIRPTPDLTELVIGNDFYMVRNGHATKLPIGGMILNAIRDIRFSADDEIKQTARDLGMQTINGTAAHAYSYTVRGVRSVMYVGPGSLPVRVVIYGKQGTTTVDYSNYNGPITIEAP